MNGALSLGNFFDPVMWNCIFGAGLGASFYVLIKTHKYLVERSYDPRYNNAYLARFATGIISGFILSQVIVYWLKPQSSGIGQLTPGLVAILGGFSAEAVEQILQRMVDLLLALVRGDGSTQVKAEQGVADAKAAAEKARNNAELLVKLSDLNRDEVRNDKAKLDKTLDEMRAMLK